MKNTTITRFNALQSILLRRRHLVMVRLADINYVQDKDEKLLVVSAMNNIQALGFTFSQRLFEMLSHLTRAEFEEFYFSLISELKKLVGADVEYNPMYPNFPEQVMDADYLELVLNALVHYWTLGVVLPNYPKEDRLPLVDETEFKVLSVGGCKELRDIFTNLVGSKTSISAQDKEDITAIIENVADYANYLPDEIPLKENVAFVGKIILEKAPVKSAKAIEKYFNTATDVLRLITALSNGDISLATRTKYRSLRRCERRIVMDLLANCGNITEDLFRYHYEWIRVAEILHPFEFKNIKYKKVNAAFNILRNEKKPLMFGGKVQSAVLKGDVIEAVNLLKERPGEFARRLDKLLRECMGSNYNRVISEFKSVAESVSAPVLLQVISHFSGRMDKSNPIRVFFPKGNLAQAISIANELPNIPQWVSAEVVDVCRKALIKQFSQKGKLGKVFIDNDLANYLVPFSQRSASKTTKTVVRGSQIPIKQNAKAVRGFIWWTNTKNSNKEYSYYGDDGRVDLDLSAAIYDENWNYVEHVSYTNLRSTKYKACHSGDITNGGNIEGKGVAEFIDIDIDAVAKNVGRYVVYQVYSYTGQKFSELPNARFGWMEREDVGSGEIFEPSTVEMKIDLTSNCTTVIPVIFDCVERKFIWCDMALSISSTRYGGNNLESNLKGATAVCYAMTHLNKPNLYDLLILNANARGEIVTDRNNADIIFSNDTTVPYEIIPVIDEETGVSKCEVRDKTEVLIVTAYDIDYIVGQLL